MFRRRIRILYLLSLYKLTFVANNLILIQQASFTESPISYSMRSHSRIVYSVSFIQVKSRVYNFPDDLLQL